MADLTPYEDRDVTSSSIRLTNAGDGLSQGMSIAPAEYHVGDIVHVVIEAQVTRVAYEPVRDTDVLRRVHTLRAGVGTIVTEQAVSAIIAKAKRDLERARGIIPLFDDDAATT